MNRNTRRDRMITDQTHNQVKEWRFSRVGLVLVSVAFLAMACSQRIDAHQTQRLVTQYNLAPQRDRAQNREQLLAATILGDHNLNDVTTQAKALILTGWAAGNGYGVFIRDLNTYIVTATQVDKLSDIKSHLIAFFELQASDGNVADEYQPLGSWLPGSAPWDVSPSAPGLESHKSTSEVDQESSLVQAVYKYVKCTHDGGFLQQVVNGTTVIERMKTAMQYLVQRKLSPVYGLLVGVTTIDWGDAPLDLPFPGDKPPSGTSRPAISIYGNAMFIVALSDLIAMLPADQRAEWLALRAHVVSNARRYLWDTVNNKFKPHIYLDASPFPSDFDEMAIEYHGGTAVAIEAGLLSNHEIRLVNAQMLIDMQNAGAPSIALDIYPPYPTALAKNYFLCAYCYQNGGSWPWFGARMIKQLVVHGMVEEAYEEIKPMVREVVRDRGFNEWYNLKDKASGAWNVRGDAGVLAEAIDSLEGWARLHSKHNPSFRK